MKNWTELENSSFFDANARERAFGHGRQRDLYGVFKSAGSLLQPASAGTWDCCGI